MKIEKSLIKDTRQKETVPFFELYVQITSHFIVFTCFYLEGLLLFRLLLSLSLDPELVSKMLAPLLPLLAAAAEAAEEVAAATIAAREYKLYKENPFK